MHSGFGSRLSTCQAMLQVQGSHTDEPYGRQGGVQMGQRGQASISIIILMHTHMTHHRVCSRPSSVPTLKRLIRFLPPPACLK